MPQEPAPEFADVFRAFLRGTGDTVAILDDGGTFLALVADDAFAGRTDLVGMNVRELMPLADAEQLITALRATKLDGPTVVLEHKRPSRDGVRDVRASMTRRRDGTVIAYVKDITAIRHAEAELRGSNERFKLLARATTDAVFDWDVVADTVFWNEQLHATFGYRTSEATNFQWWEERVHRDDVVALLESMKRAMTVQKNEVWTAEHRFRAADGSYRHVVDRTLILRDERTGHVTRVVGSMLDVTEQRKTTERLARADRVLALATLAAGVGHELNGPLNYLSGNHALAVEILRDEAEGDPDGVAGRALKLLVDAEVGLARAKAIVHELSTMTRVGDSAGTVVDLHDIVHDSLQMLDPELQRRAQIQVKKTGDAVVDGSRHRLGEVVTNLITNALEALSDASDGRIEIALATDGRDVTLDIEDNGSGISEEESARLFEPFFTTGAQRGGTGFGLAIAHAIVTAHRGQIELVRSGGGGTHFRVMLPASVARPLEAQVQSRRSLASSRQRVLVVDDDDLTLHLARQILDEHEVVTVRSVEAALELLDTREFDVVLSDVVMPVLDGRALHDAVLARTPTIAFAFMTGAPDAAMSAGVPCLSKPFSPDALRALVLELSRRRTSRSA